MSFLTPPPDERRARRRRVREAVVTELRRYNPGAPVVCGLDWGHTTPTAPLPLGGQVTIDPTDRRVTFV